MPMYEFELEDGSVVEEYFTMADAPEIGSLVVLPGRGLTARRVVSKAPGGIDMKWEHVSQSLHRNHPHAPRVDGQGRPVFRSKAEVMEFKAKSEGRYDLDR